MEEDETNITTQWKGNYWNIELRVCKGDFEHEYEEHKNQTIFRNIRECEYKSHINIKSLNRALQQRYKEMKR